jgi:hypothetical protein
VEQDQTFVTGTLKKFPLCHHSKTCRQAGKRNNQEKGKGGRYIYWFQPFENFGKKSKIYRDR